MDPEVATSVSYEIAGAIAEFLGIDAPSAGRRKLRTAKKGGFGAPGIIALVLSLGLLAAGFYAAHLNPIFGCTLFPSSGKLGDISCKWYGTRNSAGQEFTVVFLRNEGEGAKKISSADHHALEGYVFPSLIREDEGLVVLQGLGGLTYVRANGVPVANDSLESLPARQVVWSYASDSTGSKKILITNPTDTRIRLFANSIMLASRGAIAKVCVIEGPVYLEPGTTEIDVANSLRAITPNSDSMVPGVNTDLYLNGVKVPLDSGENN